MPLTGMYPFANAGAGRAKAVASSVESGQQVAGSLGCPLVVASLVTRPVGVGEPEPKPAGG